MAGSGHGHAWAEAFGRAPIGVLALGALLFFVGAGMVMSGVFLLVSRVGDDWPAWIAMLIIGSLASYVALRFMLLRRRARHIVVALLSLLLISSVIRAVTAERMPVTPILEVLGEVLSLSYLFRARVRQAFGA